MELRFKAEKTCSKYVCCTLEQRFGVQSNAVIRHQPHSACILVQPVMGKCHFRLNLHHFYLQIKLNSNYDATKSNKNNKTIWFNKAFYRSVQINKHISILFLNLTLV